MGFDELVHLMRIKQQLSIKYATLGSVAGSKSKRSLCISKSRHYQRQAVAYCSRIRLKTFVEKIEKGLLRRIKRTVIPIIRENWSAMTAGGTGNLFAIGRSHFVITAAHVIDRSHGIGLGMYVPRYRSNQLVQLTGDAAFERKLDIAALRLSDHVSSALQGYTFLTPSDVDTARRPSLSGLYWVYGFPSLGTFPSIVECKLYGRGLSIMGSLMRNDPRFPRVSAEYVWINAFANSYDLDGISGAGIWRAHVDGHSPFAWEPRHAKVVAIETSTYRNHTVIEGTRIRHVFRMIAARWPDLAPALLPHL